jgi:hypothetical protein
MPTGFVATEFGVTEEDEVLVTTLGAESTEDEDFYLMVQHANEYDDQDVKLGMDKPYIEYCGQGWSWYGHIDRFELLRTRIKVQMNAEAAAHMGNDGLIEVDFNLGDSDFARLRQSLATTFAGQSYYADRA